MDWLLRADSNTMVLLEISGTGTGPIFSVRAIIPLRMRSLWYRANLLRTAAWYHIKILSAPPITCAGRSAIAGRSRFLLAHHIIRRQHERTFALSGVLGDAHTFLLARITPFTPTALRCGSQRLRFSPCIEPGGTALTLLFVHVGGVGVETIRSLRKSLSRFPSGDPDCGLIIVNLLKLPSLSHGGAGRSSRHVGAFPPPHPPSRFSHIARHETRETLRE